MERPDGRSTLSAPVVCTIGTTDPWNAAGLGLDVRVLAELGARAVSVVAAVSVQDATGIRELVALDESMVRAQWEALRASEIAAVRIGALCGASIVRAVAEIVAVAGVPIVYDPVLSASRGGRFADSTCVAAIAARLLPAVTVCTPNMSEAAQLTGHDVRTIADMEVAGASLCALGARAAVVTGGHLEGPPVDVLVTGAEVVRFAGSRIDKEVRGTGCLLATTLAFELAKGVPLRAAVTHARAFVRKKIAGAVRAGDFWIAE